MADQKTLALFDGKKGKYMWGKKAYKSREIASLTKIMTCYVSISVIKRLKLKSTEISCKVSRTAACLGGTTAELCEGDTIFLYDLLFGLMLPSGNDAAYVLAEYLGLFLYYENVGKLSKINDLKDLDARDEPNYKDFITLFINEMNRYARDFGLLNTFFANSHGLPNRMNKSTSYDIGKLTCNAMENELLKKIVGTRYYSCYAREKNGDVKEMFWENTNKLLDEGYNGVKTGITTPAGACLAASYQDDDLNKNIHLIVVVLGANGVENRFLDSSKIIEWGKLHFI